MKRWWMLTVAGMCTVACSSTGDPSEPIEDDSADLQAANRTCAPAASQAANVAYKRAVARSKIRATCPSRVRNNPELAQSCNVPAPGACEPYPGGGGVTQVEIAGDMFASIKACGSYANVLRTSRWAEPVRKALSGTLDYSSLVGDLDVSTGRGLRQALERGITLESHASGANGPMTTLNFKTGGKLVAEKLEFDEQTDSIVSKPYEGTYAVQDKKVVVTLHGSVTTYDVVPATADEPIKLVDASGATPETTFTMGYECES